MDGSAFEKFRAGIPQLLKTVGQRGMDLVGASVSMEMDAGYPVEAPSHRAKQAQLAVSGGRLLQSFMTGAAAKSGRVKAGDRIREFKVDESKVKVKVASGVPYAAIHDTGGSISPTPKMRKFFMAMWLKTGGKTENGRVLGDPFWFAMFVHASKGKAIVIPRRAYREQAMKNFQDGWGPVMEKAAEEWTKSIGLD